MKLFSALLGSVLSASVLAADVKVSWNAPTNRTDGSPIPSAELAGYAAAITNTETVSTTSINTTETEVVFTDLPSGPYSVSVIAVDSGGLTSGSSTPIEYVIEADINIEITGVEVTRKTVEETIKTIEETYKVQ